VDGDNVLFCYLGQNSGGLILLQCDVTLFVCVLHPFIAALFAGSVPFYRSRLELTTWNLIDSYSVSESFKVLALGFNPNKMQEDIHVLQNDLHNSFGEFSLCAVCFLFQQTELRMRP
jgi:hypothetical protein